MSKEGHVSIKQIFGVIDEEDVRNATIKARFTPLLTPFPLKFRRYSTISNFHNTGLASYKIDHAKWNEN